MARAAFGWRPEKRNAHPLLSSHAAGRNPGLRRVRIGKAPGLRWWPRAEAPAGTEALLPKAEPRGRVLRLTSLADDGDHNSPSRRDEIEDLGDWCSRTQGGLIFTGFTKPCAVETAQPPLSPAVLQLRAEPHHNAGHFPGRPAQSRSHSPQCSEAPFEPRAELPGSPECLRVSADEDVSKHVSQGHSGQNRFETWRRRFAQA